MTNFYLAPGGPFDTLLARLGLGTPRSRAVTFKRAMLLAGLTWLPLMILSGLEGNALGGPLPFLRDYVQHIRFLIAVPLFIFAESIVNEWTRTVIDHFLESGIVTTQDRDRYARALDLAAQARDSRFAELLLLIVAYGIATASRGIFFHGVPRNWLYQSGTDTFISLAGAFFFWFSGPLYMFLLLRWLWRFWLWILLLARISRLNLHLNPTHPDELAGLEFVVRGHSVFVIVIFAATCVTASTLGLRMRFLGHLPFSPQTTVVAYVVGAFILLMGPLAVFSPRLFIAKKQALLRYGLFANTLVRLFDEKWARGRREITEALLGSQDVSSLADIGQSVDRVHRTKIFLFDRQVFLACVVLIGVPFLPLLLREIPVSELFSNLVGLVFGHE